MTFPSTSFRIALAGTTLLVFFPSAFKFLAILVLTFWILKLCELPILQLQSQFPIFRHFHSSDIGWYLLLSASPLIILRSALRLIEYIAWAMSRSMERWEAQGKVNFSGINLIAVMGAMMILEVNLRMVQLLLWLLTDLHVGFEALSFFTCQGSAIARN